LHADRIDAALSPSSALTRITGGGTYSTGIDGGDRPDDLSRWAQENPAQAKFCNECGARLAATCANCSHENAPGRRAGHPADLHRPFGFPQIAAYCASKGGLAQLTRVMAVENAKHGIRVNAVGAGDVVTNLLNHFIITYHPAEELQGREVQLIQASRKGLVEGAREAAESCLKALNGEPPALVFMVSCAARSTILHSRMDLEVDAVRSVLGRGAPIFGYYACGEIALLLNAYEEAADAAHEFAGSFYHTTTICLLALGAARPTRSVVRRRAHGRRASPADEARRLRTLLAESEDTLDSVEGFMAGLSRKSYQDGERLKRQNEVIHRYTPHQVWSQVGESVARGEYELPDHEWNGAFLFMDVRGFTAFSESRPAAEVVRTLNAIFSPATRIIYECGGDVDKFIGDCIFAAFPDARAAALAACRVLKLFDDLDATASPFAVRIGINAGRAVRANVGSPARREYTFIGDAVKLAQRLESNATPGRILVAEAVWEAAGDLFAEAERRVLAVRGRAQTVVAYECRPA
jgi:class 3 adenylate cyclase